MRAVHSGKQNDGMVRKRPLDLDTETSYALIEPRKSKPQSRAQKGGTEHEDDGHLEGGVEEYPPRRRLRGLNSAIRVVRGRRAKERGALCGRGGVLYGSERICGAVVVVVFLGPLMQHLVCGLHVKMREKALDERDSDEAW